jgi:hypothetical protein
VCRSEIKKVTSHRKAPIDQKKIAEAVTKALKPVLKEMVKDAVDDGMDEEDIISGVLDAAEEAFKRSLDDIEERLVGVGCL